MRKKFLVSVIALFIMTVLILCGCQISPGTAEYTVIYYYNGVPDSEKTEIGSGQIGQMITAVPNKAGEAYMSDPDRPANLPFALTNSAQENTICIYYIDDATVEYTIEYYYGDYPLLSLTQTGKPNSVITAVPNKTLTYFKIDENRPANLPFSLTAHSWDNMIRIYYTIDPDAFPSASGPISSHAITDIVDAYFQKIDFGHLLMLVNLGLMAESKARVLFDRPTKTLPDGQQYWETGVSYADLENACLRYLSKNRFDQMYFCCMDVLNGQIIYYADSGHGLASYFGLRHVYYLGSASGLHRYLIHLEPPVPGEAGGSELYPFLEFTIVLENNRYVVDRICSL